MCMVFSSYTFACDRCATQAIKDGMAAIKTAVESLKNSIDSSTDALAKLNDQIKTSSDDNVKSVNDFTDEIVKTLDKSTDDIVKQTQGVIASLSTDFTLMNKIQTEMTKRLANHISQVTLNTIKTIKAEEDMYRAGGVYGHFTSGDKADSAFLIYDENLLKAQKVYQKNANFIANWNSRSDSLNKIGRSALLNINNNKNVENSDSLIYRLDTSSLISQSDYDSLISFIALGINPNQIGKESPEYLHMVAVQSELLTKVIFKAPIISLSESNKNELSSVLDDMFIKPEDCSPELINEGDYCTSLKSILDGLTNRTLTAEYALALHTSSERALLEENVRSNALSNLILRYRNQLESQNELTLSLQ